MLLNTFPIHPRCYVLALWCSSISWYHACLILHTFLMLQVQGTLIFEYAPRIRIRVENRNRIRAQPVNYVSNQEHRQFSEALYDGVWFHENQNIICKWASVAKFDHERLWLFVLGMDSWVLYRNMQLNITQPSNISQFCVTCSENVHIAEPAMALVDVVNTVQISLELALPQRPSTRLLVDSANRYVESFD